MLLAEPLASTARPLGQLAGSSPCADIWSGPPGAVYSDRRYLRLGPAVYVSKSVWDFSKSSAPTSARSCSACTLACRT